MHQNNVSGNLLGPPLLKVNLREILCLDPFTQFHKQSKSEQMFMLKCLYLGLQQNEIFIFY